MQLTDVTAFKERRTVGYLLFKRIKILIGLMRLTSDDFIAATEVAKLVAERDMDIQRQRALRITSNRFKKCRLTEAF